MLTVAFEPYYFVYFLAIVNCLFVLCNQCFDKNKEKRSADCRPSFVVDCTVWNIKETSIE